MQDTSSTAVSHNSIPHPFFLEFRICRSRSFDSSWSFLRSLFWQMNRQRHKHVSWFWPPAQSSSCFSYLRAPYIERVSVESKCLIGYLQCRRPIAKLPLVLFLVEIKGVLPAHLLRCRERWSYFYFPDTQFHGEASCQVFVLAVLWVTCNFREAPSGPQFNGTAPGIFLESYHGR